MAKIDELERNTLVVALPAPKSARKFSTEDPPSCSEILYVEQPGNAFP